MIAPTVLFEGASLFQELPYGLFGQVHFLPEVFGADAFGTVTNDKNWTSGNASAYAGIMTGDLNDTQVGAAVGGKDKIASALASCYYGVDFTENEVYLAILAAAAILYIPFNYLY